MGTNTFVSKNVDSSFFFKNEEHDLENFSLDSVKSEIEEILFSQPDDHFNFEIPLTVPKRTSDLVATQSDFKFLETQPENRRKNSFFDYGASKQKIKSSQFDFFDFESQKEKSIQSNVERNLAPSEGFNIPLTPIILPKEEYFTKKSDYFRSSPSNVIDSKKQNKSKSIFTENSVSKIQISSSNSSHYNVSSSNIELDTLGSISNVHGQSSSNNKNLNKSIEFKKLFMEKNIRKAMSYKRSKVADNKIYNSARIERIKNIKKIGDLSTIVCSNLSERSGILKNRSMDSFTSKKSNSVTFASEPKKPYVKPSDYKPFNIKQKMIFDSWHKAKPYKKPRVEEIPIPTPVKETVIISASANEESQTLTKHGSDENIVPARSPIVLPSIFTSFLDAPLRKPIQQSIDKNIKCRTDPGIFID